MKALIVVPAYNEELNLKRVVDDIKKNCKYDYIIVNDCSKDNTEELCIKNNYNYISLPINYGLSSVVQLGFKYALINNYDAVIQFDGDGQHHAKYINKLVKELEKGNDIVIGSRFVDKKKPYSLRMIGSRIISFLIKITTGKKITDPTSGFRIYSKKLIPEFANYINYPPEPDCLVYLLRRKFKIKEIQVEMSEREYGTSYLNTFKSFEYMLRICISILFIQLFRRK